MIPILYNFFFKYSLKDVVIDSILNRVVKAPRHIRLLRLSKCKICDQLVKILQKTHHCGKCGCFVVKKVAFLKSRCPLNKW